MPILLPARRKMSSRKTANGEKTPCPGWKSSPPRWRGSAGLEGISASGRLDRVPIKWYHLIDKDAAQYQRVGACPDRKSRATFSGHALDSTCHGVEHELRVQADDHHRDQGGGRACRPRRDEAAHAAARRGKPYQGNDREGQREA